MKYIIQRPQLGASNTGMKYMYIHILRIDFINEIALAQNHQYMSAVVLKVVAQLQTPLISHLLGI